MPSCRRVVFPVVLLAAAFVAVSASLQPVEAMTAGAPTGLVRQVFAAGNFPAYAELASQSIPGLPEGKGKDLVQQRCVMCHAANVWMSQHHTRDQWGTVVEDMLSKGLQASDDEQDTIVGYLAQNFGPVAKETPAAAPPASDPAAAKPPSK